MIAPAATFTDSVARAVLVLPSAGSVNWAVTVLVTEVVTVTVHLNVAVPPGGRKKSPRASLLIPDTWPTLAHRSSVIEE